jgi:succinyl-CoA synthetase beta subunit
MAEGLVALNIHSADAAITATIQILDRLNELAEGAVTEVLVAEQVAGGLDLLVGSVEDPEIGLAIVIGLGGTHAELISDVAYLIPPFTLDEVEAALRRLRNSQMVNNYLSNITDGHHLVATAVQRFSYFVAQHRDRFTSVEINPLRVTTDGRVVMLDTLFT